MAVSFIQNIQSRNISFTKIIFISACFVFLCVSFPKQTHASFELISHWTLNESSGTRVDSEGDNDLSTVNNTPMVAGQVGNAASFPTASSTYLTINDNASLSTTGTTTFKISLYAKLLAKGGTQVFVSKYASGGQGEYAVYYENSFKRFVFSTYAGGSGNHYVLADALGEPQIGQWYFIEVEHDGENNTNKITIDGVHTNTLTNVPRHQDTTAAFRIGAFGPTPLYFANAVIDDVKFYKETSDLVAHWKFDEGSGSTATDATGNGWNGTIVNSSYSATVPDVSFTNTHSLYFNPANTGRIVTTSLSLNNYPAFTLTGWAYPTSAESRASWFGQNDVFEFGFTDSNTLFCYTSKGEVSWGFNPSTFLNNWHYIACLGTGTDLIIYVDGVNVASTPASGSGGYGSSGSTFSIGAGAVDGGDTGPFSGYIDDVRVYSRGLTAEEMYSLSSGSEEPENNPIISTFSPADNASNVSLSTNLVATFSTTTIATSTGTIGIYKASNNVLFESIAVTGSQITKSGAVITINPNGTFEENTEYYVSIPSTAFRDSGNLFYNGTEASSTWSFTTGDFSAPTFSQITSASTTSTTTKITWTTTESASSKVVFGLTSAYSSTTPETNTSPRVTSHSIDLSSLLSCTTYHYAVVSRDAGSNSATSTDQTFTTLGCTADTIPSTATSTLITSASGGTTSVTEDNKTFTVTAPADATDDSSSFVIQVKAIPSDDVLDLIGRPNPAPREVGSTVFDVKAIINGTTILDSFDAEITIEYEYSDSEISGLNESTLWLYHYTGGAWEPLDDCSVDVNANSISCTTPSFSIFGLFGTASSQSNSSPSRSASGTSIQSRYNNLLAMGNVQGAETIKKEWHWLFASSSVATSQSKLTPRDLKLGMTGEDVLLLQKFLNANGFILTNTGIGSPGNETTYFGSLTKKALSAYQAAQGITPSQGYFGGMTRRFIEGRGVSVWWR